MFVYVSLCLKIEKGKFSLLNLVINIKPIGYNIYYVLTFLKLNKNDAFSKFNLMTYQSHQSEQAAFPRK